jgi:hypothetical protein
MRSDTCAQRQVVRKEFQPVVPSLIIVPNSSMAYWKGEVEYWLEDNSEVVFYTGPPGARQQIAANELWLQPGALDGKIRGRVDYLKARVPKPHIVVISMESMLHVRTRLHASHALSCMPRMHTHASPACRTSRR